MATLYLDHVVLRSREYDNLIAASASLRQASSAYRVRRGIGGRRVLSQKDYWSLISTIRTAAAVLSTCSHASDERGAAE